MVQVNIITINIDRTVKLFQDVRRVSKWTSAPNTGEMKSRLLECIRKISNVQSVLVMLNSAPGNKLVATQYLTPTVTVL